MCHFVLLCMLTVLFVNIAFIIILCPKICLFVSESTWITIRQYQCYLLRYNYNLQYTPKCTIRHALGGNRPYPVIWKTVPIRINILKHHQVNFCIENITLSKFQGDTSNSFPDIAFRIYINSYEKLAICTWVGTKYCILPTLNQRVLHLKTL